ncbi:MAG: adenylate/guanylate cyclase domain-containing protein [Solirubrobacteraceae bacterium]
MIAAVAADVLLTILGGVACVVLVSAGVWLLPRLARRSRFLRRLGARLRSRGAIERIVSWVEAEQPDLRCASAPDGAVTLLFSDIENSTRLIERLGDDRWMELLAAHNTIVRAQVDEHGGYEVKSQGDGFMVAFPAARQAVLCAIDIQRALLRRAARGDFPIRVRIGIHTGEAIRHAGDFFGRSVVMTARIADHAEGGDILVSSLVRELVAGRGDIVAGPAGQAQFKGLDGRHELFSVAWSPPEATPGEDAPQRAVPPESAE